MSPEILIHQTTIRKAAQISIPAMAIQSAPLPITLSASVKANSRPKSGEFRTDVRIQTEWKAAVDGTGVDDAVEMAS
jgi:hypothetical protein